MAENKKAKKAEEITLGEPMEEVVDFLTEHFGMVEKEGRKVKGFDRIKALKKEMSKSKKEAK